LLGDVLTEVYGYSVSRRIIWTGFGALLFSVAMIELVLALPPSPNWHHQREYEIVFGMEWRIAMASMIAYASGEFMNAFVMAKMKIATAGRFLWTRTIGSTILGELVDTLIFYPIAFLGNPEFPLPLLATIMVSNYLGKVGWEVVATPATYLAVGWLKQAEGSDPYDRVIDFSPLAMS
jgi:hypothetical protein